VPTTISFNPSDGAPARVVSLAATSPALLTVNATWNAPGDDGPCGQAASYEMAWSTNVLTPANFASANAVSLSAPQTAGGAEAKTFSAPQNLIYVGLRARDEAGNPGRLSVTTVKVLPEPGAAAGVLAGTALLAGLRRRRLRR